MLLVYKNKGILVPVYFGVSVLTTALISGVLKRNVGGLFASAYSLWILFGIGALISGIWTILTSEVYTQVNGVRVKVDFESSFFFIPMRIFGWILIGIGLISLGWGIWVTMQNHGFSQTL